MLSRKGRIAVLSFHSCPMGRIGGKDTGGMSIYLRELSRELQKLGFTLDIYTRLNGDKHPVLMKLYPGVRLIHLEAGPQEHLDKLQVYKYLNLFNLSLESFRREKGLHYDLIFSHYWLSGWAGLQLQKWWQIPQVIMFHTLGAMKNASCREEAEPRLRLETEKLLARRCQRVIAATKKEKEQLISLGAKPENIRAVPCGVNLELFRPLDKKKSRQKLGLEAEKIILFVGRLEPIKGLKRLLRAAKYLKGRHGLKLVIVGGDEHSLEEIRMLEKLAHSLQIRDMVSFLGLVDHEMLPYYYSAADVCAVASYYESFGLVALEALSCGTPVVATEVGILPEIIRQGETGYLLPNNCSASSLADRLAYFLDKNSRYPAAAVRETVSSFGWHDIARQVKEVFDEMIS